MNSIVSISAFLLAFLICNGCAFSHVSPKNHLPSNLRPSSSLIIHRAHGGTELDRSSFIKRATNGIIGTIASTTIAVSPIASFPSPGNAIEFVPASPFFQNTYSDAVQIMYAQRLALDNIANVITDGNIEEAGFKVMQLIAQTREAGKIILETIQGQIPKNNGGVMLLRFLSCQKKFAFLLDLCDDCGDSLQNVMKKGKNGNGTTNNASAIIKCLSVVEETKGAYDDFLADLKTVEKELESK